MNKTETKKTTTKRLPLTRQTLRTLTSDAGRPKRRIRAPITALALSAAATVPAAALTAAPAHAHARAGILQGDGGMKAS